MPSQIASMVSGIGMVEGRPRSSLLLELMSCLRCGLTEREPILAERDDAANESDGVPRVEAHFTAASRVLSDLRLRDVAGLVPARESLLG